MMGIAQISSPSICMGVLVQSEDDLAVVMKPVSLHSFREFFFFIFIFFSGE